jgi:hypothetical protein
MKYRNKSGTSEKTRTQNNAKYEILTAVIPLGLRVFTVPLDSRILPITALTINKPNAEAKMIKNSFVFIGCPSG